MIQEQYVSFKTGKLLKEKGFDEECYHTYHPVEDTMNVVRYHTMSTQKNSTLEDKSECSAPTQSLAMRWLREVHNIVLSINPNDHDGTIKWRIEAYKVYLKNDCLLHEGKIIWNAFLPNYEEACEAAIKYCLENLI